MNANEIREVLDRGELGLPFEISTLTEASMPFNGTTITSPIINNKIALPVVTITSYSGSGGDIGIYNKENEELGVLCFTKDLSSEAINSFTENQFISFLTEASPIALVSPYRLLSSYAVLNISYFQNYLDKYALTAPLWGGYYHNFENSSSERTGIEIDKIIAIPDLELPQSHHYDTCVRAINQPYAFERFLKLYHLLELNFDYDLISRIKQLDINQDANQIGLLLREYQRDDILRLTDILRLKCVDIPPIVNALNKVIGFRDIATDMFYKYGKESNPLKEVVKFDNILNLGGFEEDYVKKALGKFNIENTYQKFIIKLTSYWVYRIRSSIAHSKIGEYVMDVRDEKFVTDFAEPLLKELLLQCFKTRTN